MGKLHKFFKNKNNGESTKCNREGCSYTAHTKQGHGFCCGCCKDQAKVAHGGCCERVEFKEGEKKEKSVDLASTQPQSARFESTIIDLNCKKESETSSSEESDEVVELGKCNREGCTFVQHKNKDGFCCHKCKNKGKGKHGGGCERKVIK